MAEYTAATTVLATAAAVLGSSSSYRQQDRAYRAVNEDEYPSSWSSPRSQQNQQNRQRQQRPPLLRVPDDEHFYYSLGIHNHHRCRVDSPCCYQAYLRESIRTYTEDRRVLRRTYLCNLRHLGRMHMYQLEKTDFEKQIELDQLYVYYVGRVRASFDFHRRELTHLWGYREYLSWVQPTIEDPERLRQRDAARRNRAARSSTANGSNRRDDDTTRRQAIENGRADPQRLGVDGLVSRFANLNVDPRSQQYGAPEFAHGQEIVYPGPRSRRPPIR
ncbi:hypothetical protein AAE478_001151 [Parahypoxylon ruwenzoriense]